MPSLSLEMAARDLIEKIELWRDFTLGYKDVSPVARSAVVVDAGLLQRCHEIYRGYFAGTVCTSTWRRLLSTLPMLLSTNHIRAGLNSAQTQFPEDFRAWLRSLNT